MKIVDWFQACWSSASPSWLWHSHIHRPTGMVLFPEKLGYVDSLSLLAKGELPMGCHHQLPMTMQYPSMSNGHWPLRGPTRVNSWHHCYGKQLPGRGPEVFWAGWDSASVWWCNHWHLLWSATELLPKRHCLPQLHNREVTNQQHPDLTLFYTGCHVGSVPLQNQLNQQKGQSWCQSRLPNSESALGQSLPGETDASSKANGSYGDLRGPDESATSAKPKVEPLV